jgi:hypothetical protein
MITLEDILQKGSRVTKLLEKKDFLSKTYTGSTELAIVIRDVSLADHYSWMQDASEAGADPPSRFPNWLGSDFEFWSELRDLERAKIKKGKAKVQDKFSSYLSTLVWDRLTLPASLEEGIGTLRDEIYADMEDAYLNEYLGQPSALFDQILEAYEQGGWPCGWLGKYPSGKLIVLDPNLQ